MLRRRRRFLIAQAWSCGILVFCLLLAWILLNQNLDRQRITLHGLDQQLARTNHDLQRLGEIESLTRQLQQQDNIVRRLGTYVPVARLIDVLADAMPPEMALLELQMTTQEQSVADPTQRLIRGAEVPIDHVLTLRVVGVAPSDLDLSTFIGNMERIPYFSDGQLANSQGRLDSGHVMREFDVSFTMDLDPNLKTDPNSEAAAQ